MPKEDDAGGGSEPELPVPVGGAHPLPQTYAHPRMHLQLHVLKMHALLCLFALSDTFPARLCPCPSVGKAKSNCFHPPRSPQGNSARGKDEYGGSEPFSEPESRAVRELALKYKPTAYVNVHSGEWAMYYPWDHKLVRCATVKDPARGPWRVQGLLGYGIGLCALL